MKTRSHFQTQEGDILERQVPSPQGMVPERLVVRAQGWKAEGRTTGYFETKIVVEGKEQPARPSLHPSVNIGTLTFQRPNSRFTVGTGASLNVVSSNVFNELRQAVESSTLSQDDKGETLAHVTALEQTAGTPTFAVRYGEFTSFLANHIGILQVVAPFVSALAKWIAHGLTTIAGS